MPKNVVICCDGTGNRFSDNNTNVVKLFGVLDLADESRQVAYYHSGLGTNPAAAALTRMSQSWSRVKGLAFGSGITRDIGECYQFLMDNYEEGDRVFLFGFSRGAFTVRALAGMLHMVGLLRKGNNQQVPFAVDLLKLEDAESFKLAQSFKSTFPRECKPYFIGVWDTVSSVGWIYDPLHIPYTSRSPDMSIGRHAISIDERRSFFRQNLWAKPLTGQDIKQVWFAGVHSDVGGGYPEKESDLAKITLEWMIREAVLAGLLVKEANVESVLGLVPDASFAPPDALAEQHESLEESWFALEAFPHRYWDVAAEPPRFRWRIPWGERRRIPPGSVIHQSVQERVKGSQSYKPSNLPEERTVEPWVRWKRKSSTKSTPVTTSRELPPALIDQVKSGGCLLYAGAGLSAMAGLPVWNSFAEKLTEAAHAEKIIDDENAERFRGALQDHKADYVIDAIVRGASENFLMPFLRSTFQGMLELPPSYRDLAQLPFAACMTTNFDNLLERAINGPDAPEKIPILTPKDTEALLGALTRSERFLLYLYGTLERPETLLVSPAQFDEAISSNLAFRDFVENLFISRTILFAGCSLEGIETYLRGLRFKGRSSRRHYAMCGVSGTSWQVMASGLRDRYGIEVIPYSDGSTDELQSLIASLKDAVGTAWRPKREVSHLQKVWLKGIGPFDDLSLELNRDTNIFLGNNGVGKSTILRAIAVAVSGKQANPFGSRLLRKKAETGSIEIQGGRASYKTTIQSVRTGGSGSGTFEVTPPPVIPMESEGWLALGFPPLRTSAGTRPQTEGDGLSIPSPSDAIPLARNDPDSRLSDLQKWVVKLDHRAKDEITKGVTDGPNQRLLAKFFNVIETLTEGVRIKFAGVDPATEQINVETDDGLVPLDYVSQGTASLISWVGVVLQRLYEVYGADEDPTQRFFLVLMDEIDAHMHPAWQRIMLNRVRKLFPKMQLLATTHSSLIIADLPPEKIFHVIRDSDGVVTVRQHEVKPANLESSQILTSPLFGLPYARGEGYEKDQEEYAKLRNDPKADPAEIQRLAQRLFGRTASEAEALIEKAKGVLRGGTTVAEVSPAEEKELLDRAQEMLKRKLTEA
jgi:uncharacterized protein (DUF2235 family)/predicted ATP-binding protein involved in virulence